MHLWRSLGLHQQQKQQDKLLLGTTWVNGPESFDYMFTDDSGGFTRGALRFND